MLAGFAGLYLVHMVKCDPWTTILKVFIRFFERKCSFRRPIRIRQTQPGDLKHTMLDTLHIQEQANDGL